MNTLICLSGDYRGNYGGGQVYARNLVAALRSSGHTVRVLAIAVGAGLNDEMEVTESHVDGTTVREVCLNAHTLTETAVPIVEAVRSAVRHFSPEVVHANGWKAAAAVVCTEGGVPCVITAHHGGLVCPAGALLDADSNICQRPVGEHCILCCQRQMPLGSLAGAAVRLMSPRARFGFGKALQRLPFVPFVTGPLTVPLEVTRRQEAIKAIAKSKAILVAPSKAIQAALIRNGIPRERTEVVHHGIEPFAKLPLPEDLGIRPLRIAYVGRLNRVKGLHVLATAIGLLRDPAIVELHLLGAAHTRPEKRYARHLRRMIPNSCRVVDHGQLDREAVGRTLAECDILALPSIYLEVFGLVIPEAFSVGRPVIVSRCGGPEDLVRDGVDGLLVERNSAQAMATAIQSLIDSPARIATMAANILPVRTMAQNVADLERVYRRAIDLVRR